MDKFHRVLGEGSSSSPPTNAYITKIDSGYHHHSSIITIIFIIIIIIIIDY